MGYEVKDIANKILFKATDEEAGDMICNMKLQKMLYYMQGFYLAYFDRPFFDEDIEAWTYGPVVPSVYRKYKSYKNRGIPYAGDVISLGDEENGVFDEVYRVYSQYSAIGLMNLTHQEEPWTSSYPDGIIKKDVLKDFFKKKMQEDEQKQTV